MSSRASVCCTLWVLGMWGCGPLEYRVDESQGVPNLEGDTSVNLGTFTCGQPIVEGGRTVATKLVADGCELTFEETLPLFALDDYSRISELSGAGRVVRRVEVTLRSLVLTDDATGETLDLATRVRSATIAVNGQVIADKAALTSLPKTVALDGDALRPVKSGVDAREPVNAGVRVVMVLPTSPTPPQRLRIKYDLQPALVLGIG